MIVIPDVGKTALLAWLLKEDDLSIHNLYLRLFQNDYLIDAETVEGDFTEATFTGYTEKMLTRTNWTAPAIVDGKAVTTYTSTSQTWTVGAGTPNTIYGYYVVDDDSGEVVWGENFPAPLAMVEGASLAILPTFKLDELTEE